MVVHAGAEERHLVLGRHVALREAAQLGVDRLLGLALRQVDLALQPHARRDAVEQRLDRVDADRVEHDLQVLRGERRVAAHERLLTYASRSSRPSASEGSDSLIFTIQPPS